MCKTNRELQEINAIKICRMCNKEDIISVLKENSCFDKETVNLVVDILSKMDLPDITNYFDKDGNCFSYNIFSLNEFCPFIEIYIHKINPKTCEFTVENDIVCLNEMTIDNMFIICRIPVLKLFNSEEFKNKIYNNINKINDKEDELNNKTYKDYCE